MWGLLAAAWPALFHNPPPRWVRQLSPCWESSPPHLPISAPPTGLDERFFFISLVVDLPYSSIFCQFWLFLVFKLSLSFFWLCEEAYCFYLRLRLGRKPPTTFYTNACEGFGGNSSVHALFECPAFESELDREVVFFLKKDM